MRRLSLFAMIFIVMASLYWFLEGPGGKRAAHEPDHLLVNFKPAHVELINISNAGADAIVLKRADKGWQVAADYKTFSTADSAAVEALLESLAQLTTGSMVSRNADRHALYEVSPETGLSIKAVNRENQTLAEVLIGKSGPNIFSTYVRAADNDAVYLVDGILQNKTSKTLNEWREKRIFSIEPDTIRAYSVNGDYCLALRKNNNNTWLTAPEDVPIDTRAAAELVRGFAGLSAVDFTEGTLVEFGLDNPLRTITATLADGTHATLLLGRDANAFQQYAKTTADETIYIIEKHLLSMLCPTIEKLRAPAAEENMPTEPQPAK